MRPIYSANHYTAKLFAELKKKKKKKKCHKSPYQTLHKKCHKIQTDECHKIISQIKVDTSIVFQICFIY